MSSFPYLHCLSTLVQVINDPMTGRSKGFGFVRFGLEAERDRSLNEMNGVFVGSRAIRVSLATARRPGGPPGGGGGGGGYPQAGGGAYGGGGGGGSFSGPATSMNPDDPSNTTLFVGGISPMVGGWVGGWLCEGRMEALQGDREAVQGCEASYRQ